MDHRAQSAAEPVPFWRRHDLGWVLVVVFLAAGLRVWQVSHLEITATDSVAFIQYAWQLDHHPWPEVLRQANRHPGYPVAILAASRFVRPFSGGPESAVMQRSAQLASAFASVLLVLPMLFLGRELFDRQTAFGACVLFQCFPSSSQVFADGLCEALYLLFAASALWLAVRGLRTRAVWPFALCGA